ncbi:tyrosine-type recombinase/integrase [Albimonas sp. CAU 1670]|uniref:site-specific integrase n=1 Tax=Albimonas sp. CAU 1670 TaxID=3032599 RepID=UPI0023DC12E0|nr:site-specific integrase [Albimonas sp. CAU 1670]MDF2232396.1 tyrosine-type recombinase/integrase [Albimonas sp. CAU 1670]
MPKLTKKVVETLEPIEGRPTFAWDSQLSGFGVKALPSGGRKYVVKYRAGGGGRGAQQRWLTLGTHGVITCEQARAMAQQALAAVSRGEDPQAEKAKRRATPTMRDLWARFAAEQLPRKKPSTALEYESQWRDIIEPAFGSHRVDALTRSEVDRLHKRMSDTPYRANRTLALMSRLMNLAEAWEWRPAGDNPCRHVEKFKEEARERYLTAEELSRLGSALSSMVAEGDIWPEVAAAVRLLLLTGARLNEILTARWEWVNIERRVIELPDSKTGRKPLYLSAAALAELEALKAATRDTDSPFLLPGRTKGKPLNNLSKPWKRICERAAISGVRLHDLRHTAASIAVGSGATLPVIGRLLGHRQAQTTQRYAHVDADPTLAVADQLGEVLTSALRTRQDAGWRP